MCFELVSFNYIRESQNIDELEYFCAIANFLVNNRLYQQYYDFLLKAIQNKHIVRVLSDCAEFSRETYKLLYENLTRNLYAKSQVKTPEELFKEANKIYANLNAN